MELKKAADDPADLYAELDPGIRDVVRLLRSHGWNTTQSCEGGEGHAYTRPTIELVLTDHMDSVERLAQLLVESGCRPFRIEAELLVPVDGGYWTRRATIVFGEWAPPATFRCGPAWTFRSTGYGYREREAA